MADDANDVDKIRDQRPDSTSSPVNKPAKKKRKRSMISDDQAAALEKHYIREKWPGKLRKQEIAEELGRQSQFVTIWFQNRRARERRRQKREVQFQASAALTQMDRSSKVIMLAACSTWFPEHIISESAPSDLINVSESRNSCLSKPSCVPTAKAKVATIATSSTSFPKHVLSEPAHTDSISKDQLVSERRNVDEPTASCAPGSKAGTDMHLLLPNATLSTSTSLTWSTLHTDPNPREHISRNSKYRDGNLLISSSPPVSVRTRKPLLNVINSHVHTINESSGILGAERIQISGPIQHISDFRKSNLIPTSQFFSLKAQNHPVFENDSQVNEHSQNVDICSFPIAKHTQLCQQRISQIDNSLTHKPDGNNTCANKQKIIMGPLSTSTYSIVTHASLNGQMINSAMINYSTNPKIHLPNTTIGYAADGGDAISTSSSQYIQEQSKHTLQQKPKRSFGDTGLSNVYQPYVIGAISNFKPMHQSQHDNFPNEVVEISSNAAPNNLNCKEEDYYCVKDIINTANASDVIVNSNLSDQIMIVEKIKWTNENDNEVLKNAELGKSNNTWIDVTNASVCRDTNNSNVGNDISIADTTPISSRMTTNNSNAIVGAPKSWSGIHSSVESSADSIQIPCCLDEKSNTPRKDSDNKYTGGFWNMPDISNDHDSTSSVYPNTIDSMSLEYGDRKHHCNTSEDVDGSLLSIPIALPTKHVQHPPLVGNSQSTESQAVRKHKASVVCRNLCFGNDTEDSTNNRDEILIVKKSVSNHNRKKKQCSIKRTNRLMQNLTGKFHPKNIAVTDPMAVNPMHATHSQTPGSKICMITEKSLSKEKSRPGGAKPNGQLTSARDVDVALGASDYLGHEMCSTDELCKNNLINDNCIYDLDKIPSEPPSLNSFFPGSSCTNSENRYQTDDVHEDKLVKDDTFLKCISNEVVPTRVVREEHYEDVNMILPCGDDEYKSVIKCNYSIDSVEQKALYVPRAGTDLEESASTEMTLFIRMIGMAAAAEGGLLDPKQPRYAEAVSSALYGVPLKNNCRLVYVKEYGFETEPMCNELSC